MGFLDKAKKLAQQAMEKAEEAMAEAKAKSSGSGSGSGSASGPSAPPRNDPRLGTPYVPGMLGKPGWREKGLVDPAAILPITDRDRVGVPHSTKSQILEEPFGVGRRWTAGERSAGLYYQLDPEHQAWEPPSGRAPLAGMSGASTTLLPDGRTLVFLADGGRRVVLELTGLDDMARAELTRVVAEQLATN